MQVTPKMPIDTASPDWVSAAELTHLRQLQAFTPEMAQAYFLRLSAELHWNQGHYFAYGRQFNLPRLQAWYADAGVAYRYAAQLLNSHPWSPLLSQLRDFVQAICGLEFNAVLANYYRHGGDCVGWHADDEEDLGPAPIIASLSFGASREFCLRHKQTGELSQLPLSSGTLLVMLPPCQENYEHAILPQLDILEPRINLTFRRVIAAGS